MQPLLALVMLAPPAVVGNAGCSAAACHADKHDTVQTSDPHRRAFAVLFDERSARMVRSLGGREPAHRDARCLACHGAAPPNSEPLPPGHDLHRSATCENCHGAAGDYLTTHYLPGQNGRGLAPTKDLAGRATVCAGCHVGEPGRDVDHALIAAGHPALRFELASHLQPPIYTRHWLAPSDEGREWLVGQVAVARAAVALTRHRASRSDWPELSEFACSSCHRGLTGDVGSGSGRPRWGGWPLALAGDLPGCDLSELKAKFRDPDRPDPTAAADVVLARLDRVLATPPDPRRLIGKVVRADPADDWDRQAQRFLGASALYRSTLTFDRRPSVETSLLDLAAALRFPSGVDGPDRSPELRARLSRRWAELADVYPEGRP